MSSLASRRLLNTVVVALNYMYLGRAATSEEIGRCPNARQRSCYSRLRTLIAACGTSPEPFALAPGRSGPELGASLFQLEKFLDRPEFAEVGYREAYYQKFEDDPLLFPEETYPQLRPYRSLDSSRLKLTGTGSWDMQKYIDGERWLPFADWGPSISQSERAAHVRSLTLSSTRSPAMLFQRQEVQGESPGVSH